MEALPEVRERTNEELLNIELSYKSPCAEDIRANVLYNLLEKTGIVTSTETV